MQFDSEPLYFRPINIGSLKDGVTLKAAGPEGSTRYERLADEHFLNSFLSLDMESPEAFRSFVMRFGIEATFCPLLPESFWVGAGGKPTKQYVYYMAGKSDTWEPGDVEAVRVKTMAKIKATQAGIGKALETEDVEALAALGALADEHCHIVIGEIQGGDYHPRVTGADVIGAAALYAIELLTAGSRVYDRYLTCENCGRPIPLERAKSSTCSQVCQNRISNLKRAEEFREAQRMRGMARRRVEAGKWDDVYHGKLLDDISAVLNDEAMKRDQAGTMKALHALAVKYDIVGRS
jgi:hypothetical protein